MLANDVTAPVSVKELERAGLNEVVNADRIALVMDHFTPNKDIKAAQQCKCVRAFARERGIKNFFDVGEMGIEHALLPEKGLVGPGDCVIGADSHTCTYGALGAFSTGVGSTDLAAAMAYGKAWFKVPAAFRFVLKNKPAEFITGKDIILHIIGLIGVDGALYRSMEFTGDGLNYLHIDDRFTIANMAIEAGAKNGIFPVDEVTLDYIKGRFARKPAVYAADPDAEYERVIEVDLSKLQPTVAFPHLPSNTRAIGDAGNVPIDQAVIGSCTNGRITDLRTAANILRGRRVHENVRTIIFPATNEIYLQALREGLIETFIRAGAVVSTPTCGPCLGGHMGILAAGERAVATTNRNFVGRMGHPTSEVYLASPHIAAASAILGRLGSPAEL
jgi:3-isopropylmalate/(R)-2-methylmalate dehydratase large subunit